MEFSVYLRILYGPIAPPESIVGYSSNPLQIGAGKPCLYILCIGTKLYISLKDLSQSLYTPLFTVLFSSFVVSSVNPRVYYRAFFINCINISAPPPRDDCNKSIVPVAAVTVPVYPEAPTMKMLTATESAFESFVPRLNTAY